MYDARLFRQAREAGGLRQADVGREASLHASAIAAYETGRSNPSAGAMNRWETALVRLLNKRSARIGNALRTLTPDYAGSDNTD